MLQAQAFPPGRRRPIVRSEVCRRKAFEPEPIACETDRASSPRAPCASRPTESPTSTVGRGSTPTAATDAASPPGPACAGTVRRHRRRGRPKVSARDPARRESAASAASGLLVSTASNARLREIREQLRNAADTVACVATAGRRRSSGSDRGHRAAVRRRRARTRARRAWRRRRRPSVRAPPRSTAARRTTPAARSPTRRCRGGNRPGCRRDRRRSDGNDQVEAEAEDRDVEA